MKTVTKKDSIKRINLKKGNFSTISNSILTDPQLSSAAKLLLISLLNNEVNKPNPKTGKVYEINTTSEGRKLKLSKSVTANAVQCLIDNGYLLKSEKYSNGKTFYHNYIISEYGDLKANKESSTEENILNLQIEKQEDEGLTSLDVAKVATEVINNEESKPINDNNQKVKDWWFLERHNCKPSTRKTIEAEVDMNIVTRKELEDLRYKYDNDDNDVSYSPKPRYQEDIYDNNDDELTM